MTAENLKDYEFKKGVSGNPHGRPKGSTERALKYQKALNAISKGRGKPIDWTNQDAILEAIMRKAKKGNLACVQYIEACAYGKLPERVEVTSENVNYNFDNIPLEERKALLKALKNARNDTESDSASE
jgi:Family of unknown function (DUF5681)